MNPEVKQRFRIVKVPWYDCGTEGHFHDTRNEAEKCYTKQAFHNAMIMDMRLGAHAVRDYANGADPLFVERKWGIKESNLMELVRNMERVVERQFNNPIAFSELPEVERNSLLAEQSTYELGILSTGKPIPEIRNESHDWPERQALTKAFEHKLTNYRVGSVSYVPLINIESLNTK